MTPAAPLLPRTPESPSSQDLISPSVEVVLPTYQRSALLAKCLVAIAKQTMLPKAVFVVVRADDRDSRLLMNEKAAQSPLFHPILVNEPGVLAAMRAGVRASTADIIAFTDDDAEPHPEWLARLVGLLEHPGVGAAGGRDIITGQTAPATPLVGVFSRWGRPVGNHHIGTGGVREVDMLKGVSMAFRAEALAMPGPGLLRGTGAEVNFEVLVCGWAKLNGWKVLYDPGTTVDHAIAERFGPDRRVSPDPSAVFDAAYNFVIANSLPNRLNRRTIHSLLLGTRSEPALGRAAVALIRREHDVLRRVLPSICGKLLAAASLVSSPPALKPALDLRQTSSTNLDKPKVALVAHDIHPHGGMERALYELVRRQSGHYHFIIFSSTLAPELRAQVEWRQIRVPRRPFPFKFLFFFVRAGIKLRGERADIIHTCGAIVPNRIDIATIQFCHAAYWQLLPPIRLGERAVLRQINSRISKFLALAAERWCFRGSRVKVLAAVSPGTAAEMRRHYPGPVTSVTPNGVDIELFHPDRNAGLAIRQSLGLQEKETIALFVGGDWGRKGLSIAVEAVGVAAKERSQLHLWVVGDGDPSTFKQLLREFDIDDRVHFLGRRNNVEAFMQAADMFVLPTLYETFSLVAYEAAASGLPVLGSAVSGISDLVGDGAAGLLVERRPEEFAKAIGLLVDDADLRQRMGAEGRRRAQLYTWQRSAQEVGDLYQKLFPRVELPGSGQPRGRCDISGPRIAQDMTS
jgi:glycosyltransferase involved in cell wall biosynthesis